MSWSIKMSVIIDGKKLADSTLFNLKNKLLEMKQKPKLSIIFNPKHSESLIYTNQKIKKSKEIGIKTEVHQISENLSEEKLINLIEKLNENSDAIIVQLPLPKHLDTFKIINTIKPEKDVDGLTSINLEKTFSGKEFLVPATPKGIIKLLEHYKIKIKGRKITIINHSNLLGKPLSMMLLNRGATLSICHKLTEDLSFYTKNADILITATGIKDFIKENMVKDNCIIIDAGISRVNGKIYGDVDFENVSLKSKLITPVPGGVGPMTVAMLLENVLKAYKLNPN